LEYDITNGTLKQLFDFGGHTSESHFSFISQDDFVQQDAIGHPMSDELYKISLTDQSETQLVPNFLRAGGPTWSPKTKLIAFLGTEQFPGQTPGTLYSSQDIERLVSYPWDLYVMDENGNNVRKILPLVENAGDPIWSPTENLLAFDGTIQGADGIWLLDLDSNKLIRIFESRDIFAWSPDGKKLIAIETKLPDEKNDNIPIKAYILQLPDCVFAENCK
jgi:Tol biopolymer transport system component